jgi:hypothetical protein
MVCSVEDVVHAKTSVGIDERDEDDEQWASRRSAGSGKRRRVIATALPEQRAATAETACARHLPAARSSGLRRRHKLKTK